MHYWGYRVDSTNRRFFYDEILHKRLRQGWGYNENQNLKHEGGPDISARRNLPILNKVKKGDYLLIPHLEAWDEIVIVQATQDFDVGYDFDIPKDIGDYGHIFPVEYVKRFSRHNKYVEGSIRETFKCRSRFWNIDRCEEDINKILSVNEEDLIKSSGFVERFRDKAISSFNEEAYAETVYNALISSTQASEWEYILCEGFKKILPENYSIQTTSNKIEKAHGADIIIKIPGILDTQYIIAIQVKDYSNTVGDDPIVQICKADEYFGKEGEGILIDKYLIITKASKEINTELMMTAEKNGVKVLFDKEVKQLLVKMAKAFLSDTVTD